jgi:acyl carrier protein
MSTETDIERLVLDELLSGKGRTKIEPEESLIKSGILDSLSLLRLVVLIEQHFGVTVGDGELVPDNFETISRIKAFLDRKKQTK